MDKILVIEDDSQLREMLKYFLQEKGFTVHCSENGRDGIKDAERYAPDLVLLDIVMPEMDGFEVIHRMSKRNGPKIIAISGGGIRLEQAGNLLKTARYFGADKIFQKPIDLEELFRAIMGLLHPLM